MPDSFPTPGPSEFTADQEQAQRSSSGVSNDEINQAVEQNAQQRQHFNDDVNEATSSPTFGGGSSFLSRNAPASVRTLFGGK